MAITLITKEKLHHFCGRFSLIKLMLICAVLCSAALSAEQLEGTEFRIDKPSKVLGIERYQLPNTYGILKEVPPQGKLTVINFWATFCGPCRKEMPALNRLWDKYKDRGLDVQAVALDGDRKVAIEKFITRYNLTLPILLDDETGISRDYKVSVMPVTYLISADGKILGRAVGERAWDSQEAYALIESLLPEDG